MTRDITVPQLTHYPMGFAHQYDGGPRIYRMACDRLDPESRIAIGPPTCDKCHAYLAQKECWIKGVPYDGPE